MVELNAVFEIPDPWRFVAFPAVWLLVGSLVVAYVYAVRVLGPKVVSAGESIVTRRQVWCFVGAMALLWSASDWPIHEIGEGYLYSVHMLQHMMLTYLMPPLVLLATPEWALRLIVGEGRAHRVVAWFCHPVVAGLLFNVAVMVTHVPAVVEASARNPGAVHYAIHAMVVTLALLMWMPVVGPFKELYLGTAGKMVYLFLQSVVPTVPAGWLAFAEGVVYTHYGAEPLRVFGLSATADQQLAGAIMKTGGSIFLWSIIVWMWFTRFSADHADEQSYRRTPDRGPAWASSRPSPDSERDPVPLTFDDVEREFARSAPPVEPAGHPDRPGH